MRPTLFISDLHLDAAHEDVLSAFLDFLRVECANAESLYILGDLFEYWVGDDQLDHDTVARRVVEALRTLVASGVKCFFMHGNRDFLIGQRFAEESGVTILPDPTEIIVEGKRVLLMHGDTLCTDDVAYQAFRSLSRSPVWQAALLQKSYEERVALATQMRAQSTTEKSTKAEEIMDVSPRTVERFFKDTDVDMIIHGHTHRPATHSIAMNGSVRSRVVLSDWAPGLHNVGNTLALSKFVRVDAMANAS